MARRTYKPENRFVANSKLSEQEFTSLLYLYLHGFSAPQAREQFSSTLEPNDPPAPSSKTIATLFRRIGRYIFHSMVERGIAESSPFPALYNRKGADEYSQFLDVTCAAIVDVANAQVKYEDLRILLEDKPSDYIFDDFFVELRRLIAVRKGTTADYRADVGLASMRYEAATNFDKSLTDQQRIDMMMNMLLGWMFDEPLDADGNPGQVFIKEPIKFAHGNYQLPARKFWDRKNFNLKAEIRKRNRKLSEEKKAAPPMRQKPR